MFPNEEISPHFFVNDFLCSSGVQASRDPVECDEQFDPIDDVRDALKYLALYVLQPLRTLSFTRIEVQSGYRSPRLRLRMGIAGSGHAEGRAADVLAVVDGDLTSEQLFVHNAIRERVGLLTGCRVSEECSPTWYLFALMVLMEKRLPMDRIVSEGASRMAPRWIHVSHNFGREADSQIYLSPEQSGGHDYQLVTATGALMTGVVEEDKG